MEIPVKTIASGLSLPVYGLGTWEMGGRRESDIANDEKEVMAIAAAIDHGITHIDTAELYGAGHSEELIGTAIKGYDRSKLLITSKVSAFNQRYDDLLRSCEASLKRLGTDYLDLYLLHRFPESGINIMDTMRAMDRLMDEGMVKHIGVSNMTVNRFETAQGYANHPLVCNQLEYSLSFREAQKRGVVQYCQDNDILLVAWGPLQKGALENALILQDMAKKYNKTPYQVALNWLICQKNVVVIPKTTQIMHLEENLGVIGWELSPEDVKQLDQDFPDQQQISARVPLDYAADVPA